MQTPRPEGSTAGNEAGPAFLSWISSASAILAILGVILYGLQNIGYSAFYEEFGISPDDVGLGYINTLARSTGLVVVLILAVLLAIVSYEPARIARKRSEQLARLGWLKEIEALQTWLRLSSKEVARKRLREEVRPEQIQNEKEQYHALAHLLSAEVAEIAGEPSTRPKDDDLRALYKSDRFSDFAFELEFAKMDQVRQRLFQKSGRGRFAAALITIVLIVVLVAPVRALCISKAHSVQDGKPVAPINLLGLSLLNINADPAVVTPTGEVGKSAGVDPLSGKTVMYLGQANGRIVLYDNHAKRTVTLPASSVVLQINP